MLVCVVIAHYMDAVHRVRRAPEHSFEKGKITGNIIIVSFLKATLKNGIKFERTQVADLMFPEVVKRA